MITLKNEICKRTIQDKGDCRLIGASCLTVSYDRGVGYDSSPTTSCPLQPCAFSDVHMPTSERLKFNINKARLWLLSHDEYDEET